MKHNEQAKLARDDYKSLTGVRPPYPRSEKDLNKLLSDLSDVEFRRLARILNDDVLPADPIPARPPPAGSNSFYQKELAVGNYLKQFQLDAANAYDMLTFLVEIKPKISDVLRKEVLEHGPIKFAIAVKVLLEKKP